MQNNKRKENGAVGGRQMTERGKSMAEMRDDQEVPIPDSWKPWK